jgi:ribosomal protein S18 acetylase RimI-like enzyme
MVKLKLTQTDDYEELSKFFIENELEFSEEDPVPTDLVKCWKLVDVSEAAPKLIGGVVLAKRQGEFIIDGIAIHPEYRKQKLGKMLLDKAIAEVLELSGNSIYLVARAPGFFRTQGFENVPKENAPLFFECFTCPQYGISCHPEVMKLSI